MSLAEDIDQAMGESETRNREQMIWPATISSVDPLTVTLDGSGAAVPCKTFGGLTITVGRRVGVILVGSDLVVFGSFGSDVSFEDLTLTDDLVVSDTTYLNKLQWGLANPSISKTVGTSGNVTGTSTSFTTTGLGMSFVAPPSGRMLVTFSARVYVNVANGSACASPYVKTGATVDAGSDVATPSDVFSVEIGGPTSIGDFHTASGHRLIEGLTSGASYNVTLYGKSSPANSGGTTKGILTVTPAW